MNGFQCVILTKDPLYSVLLEMTIKEFGFVPKLTALMERVWQISTTRPTAACFVDLDGQTDSVTQVSTMARQFAPDTRLVFLSSAFTEHLAEECLKQSALALLVKPIKADRLVQTLAMLKQEKELIESDAWRFHQAGAGAESGDASDQAGYMFHPYLRVFQAICPACGKHFEALKFKLGVSPASSTDTDFCPICDESVHPELYSIIVCQNCLFAYYAGKFNEVLFAEPFKIEFLKSGALSDRRKIAFNLEFKGERTLIHGIKSFELAAHSVCELKVKGFIKLAGEYSLKCSWLCRRIGHHQEERRFQERALYHLQRQYEPYLRRNGRYPSAQAIATSLTAGMDMLSERGIVVTGFLAGELSRRLDLLKQAQFYFDEVTALPFFTKFTSLVHHVNFVIRTTMKG